MHRHLFSPTAVNLKKGEACYQNLYLFGHKLTYEISDNFSLTAGVEAQSLVYWEELIIFINPQFSFELSEQVHLGFGVMTGAYFWDILRDLEQVVAVAYSNLTIGTDDANLSFGFGYGQNWNFDKKEFWQVC